MFSFQKITKLTWFDVTLRAKMFSKVVKLILTGGKNDKILTTVVVWACHVWFLTKSQIHTLSMISASKLVRTVLLIATKACDYGGTMSLIVKPEVGAARNTPAEHYWLHFAMERRFNIYSIIWRYLQIFEDIFKYLKISSNKLKISSNIWRYLQMNWRYLQMNWRYLQMN